MKQYLVISLTVLSFGLACQGQKAISAPPSPSPAATTIANPTSRPSAEPTGTTSESPAPQVTKISELKVLGFSLDSKLNEVKSHRGKENSLFHFGDSQEYAWNEPELYLVAKGDNILRMRAREIQVNGELLKSEDETADSLISKYGEPDNIFYGQHGEPCYSWNSGLQADIYIDEESRELGNVILFAMTSRTDLPASEPLAGLIHDKAE